jgi:hypothetical protein
MPGANHGHRIELNVHGTSGGADVGFLLISSELPSQGQRRNLSRIRKCSSIHTRPGALALVTTGPSITTCLGIVPGPMPVFSPDTIAATPAMMAPRGTTF